MNCELLLITIKLTHLNIIIETSIGRLESISNDLGSEYSKPFTDIKLIRE